MLNTIVSKRVMGLGMALALGLVAVAGFTNAPRAKAPAQAEVAVVPFVKLEGYSAERYYTRLSRGQLGDPKSLYFVFTPEFRVRDTTRTDGC